MEEIEAIVKRISEVDPTVVSSNAKCKEIVDKIQLDNFCVKEENLILPNKEIISDLQLVIKDYADSENVEQDCSFSDNTVQNHLNEKAVNLEQLSRRSSDDVDRMVGTGKTIDMSKSNEVGEDCDSIAWTTDNFEEYIERLGGMIRSWWRSEHEIKNLSALKEALEAGNYRDKQGKIVLIVDGVIENKFYNRPEEALLDADCRPHCLLLPIPRDDNNPARLHAQPIRHSSRFTVKQRRVGRFEKILQSAAQLGSNVTAKASAIGRELNCLKYQS